MFKHNFDKQQIPQQTNGNSVVNLYFKNDLKRKSLNQHLY